MNFAIPGFSCAAKGSTRTFSMFLLPESLGHTEIHAPSGRRRQPHGKHSELLAASCPDISDILCAVRKSLFVASLVVAAAVFAFQPLSTKAQTSPAPVQGTPQAVTPAGPVIVLDPAHGGTDTGARGEAIVEKDVALQIARTVRAGLQRQGYRVVMTRNDDSNPSYDDRAAVANAYREDIFISLHVASTGAPGTVRAYYMQFADPVAAEVATNPSTPR